MNTKSEGADERHVCHSNYEAWLNATGDNAIGKRSTRHRKRLAWSRCLARTVEDLRMKNARAARGAT